MKYYNFKERSYTSGPHLIGLLLIVAGLVSTVSPVFIEGSSSLEKAMWVGAGAITLGLVIVLSYNGTLIDFDRNRVKEYSSIMGYKAGKWVTLPNITKVAVISVRQKAANTPNGISPTWSGTVTEHKVFLYAAKPTPHLLFGFSNRERALQTAKLLAANLDAACELPNQ
ncbi:hypothetical protein [Pontibacter rugosus]|uniref:PH domain-containing protein n=1 Tax=Pontibacter rugosus TaxID=1745966 RepID=A0ABW3SPP6_9BACT